MSSINGIGTAYIGCADVERDGSYVTTKWLSLVIPIVPLGSVRVWPQSHGTRYFPVFYSSSQFEAKRVPLYWPHVVKMYALYLAIILSLKVAEFLTGNNQNHNILNPQLSSIFAFALAIVALKLSKPIRKTSTFVNILVVLPVMLLSFLLAADISKTPEASWTTLYYFWGAYAVFSVFVFLRNDPSANDDGKKRR